MLWFLPVLVVHHRARCWYTLFFLNCQVLFYIYICCLITIISLYCIPTVDMRTTALTVLPVCIAVFAFNYCYYCYYYRYCFLFFSLVNLPSFVFSRLCVAVLCWLATLFLLFPTFFHTDIKCIWKAGCRFGSILILLAGFGANLIQLTDNSAEANISGTMHHRHQLARITRYTYVGLKT